MAVLATGTTFVTNQQVTATSLNNAVNNATFNSGAVDNSTTQLSGGAIIVKDGGITGAKLASGAVTASKLDTTAANGELFIGNGTGFTKATLTAGAGMTVTNASGAITLAQSTYALSTITYASSLVLDFSDLNDLKTVALTGNVTLSTSNRAAGYSYLLRIVGDGSSRTITVSSSWKFVGQQPTANTFTLGANKTAVLNLLCFGTAETDVLASYSAQP